MKVVTQFHAGDRPLLEKLLAWIAFLAPQGRHKLLLLADPADTTGDLDKLHLLALKAFNQAEIDFVAPGPAGNVFAYNRGLTKALTETEEPFLWLEPDCVPLRADWLDAIERHYIESGKPFLGTTFERRGRNYLHSNAVYPAHVERYNHALLYAVRTPVESVAPLRTLIQTQLTGLIQHVYVGPDGQPPTFPDVGSLDMLRSGAVLWHRCKDGTLIDRLKERMFR